MFLRRVHHISRQRRDSGLSVELPNRRATFLVVVDALPPYHHSIYDYSIKVDSIHDHYTHHYDFHYYLCTYYIGCHVRTTNSGWARDGAPSN